MRRWSVVLALGLAGCAPKAKPLAAVGTGPAAARLPVGSAAVLASEHPTVLIRARPGPVEETGVAVATGTRVEVEEDQLRPTVHPERSEKAMGRVDSRSVRVRVVEGERAGLVGVLPRYNLRPAAK